MGVVRKFKVERVRCELRSGDDVTDRKGGASSWFWFATGVVVTILVLGDPLMGLVNARAGVLRNSPAARSWRIAAIFFLRPR